MMTALLHHPEFLLGPLGGLLLSLIFCFQFFKKFEATTEQLFQIFETELELCHHRYNFVLTELMKLKNK